MKNTPFFNVLLFQILEETKTSHFITTPWEKLACGNRSSLFKVCTIRLFVHLISAVLIEGGSFVVHVFGDTNALGGRREKQKRFLVGKFVLLGLSKHDALSREGSQGFHGSLYNYITPHKQTSVAKG